MEGIELTHIVSIQYVRIYQFRDLGEREMIIRS